MSAKNPNVEREAVGQGGRHIELSTVSVQSGITFKCKARKTADPPQDCDWPVCGCDPYADKVIEALQESGKLAPRPEASMRELHPGQYVWVEGKLTETQPAEFPAKLRVYVHGVGTGIAKTVKPVEEAALAALPEQEKPK